MAGFVFNCRFSTFYYRITSHLLFYKETAVKKRQSGSSQQVTDVSLREQAVFKLMSLLIVTQSCVCGHTDTSGVNLLIDDEFMETSNNP